MAAGPGQVMVDHAEQDAIDDGSRSALQTSHTQDDHYHVSHPPVATNQQDLPNEEVQQAPQEFLPKTSQTDMSAPDSSSAQLGQKILPLNAKVVAKKIVSVRTPGGNIQDTSSHVSESESDSEPNKSSAPKKVRPKTYMTKRRKTIKKKVDKEQRKAVYSRAVSAFLRGKFKSVTKCAEFYEIPRTTLRDLINNGDEYRGSGRKLRCLTPEEEPEIVKHVKMRASIGCGVDWQQLQSLVQEVLLAVKKSNPDRITGYEQSGQLPNIQFVRRLADRHNLTLRRSSEISKGTNRKVCFPS